MKYFSPFHFQEATQSKNVFASERCEPRADDTRNSTISHGSKSKRRRRISRRPAHSDDEDSDNIHPYLRLKAKVRDQQYGEKTHETTLSFGKRDSPIHAEVIDIRNPSKTIICTYDHQPRLFVPLQNKKGYFLRPILPDELKQIQGFPKDFKLNGPKKEQIRQIGNAAPPILVEHIVKEILEG